MRSILSLNSYIAPKLLRIVYWIGLICIGVFALAGIYNALTYTGDLRLSTPQTGFMSLVIVIFLTIAATIIWRLAVELILVVFSIHDLLRDIRNQVAPNPQPVYNRRSTDPR
ncbi:DUF4282 domain-containing protein [Devosia sp. WQ 349]|uniref:DUF4282 domain-containing protein n=1 Tax=Devosia sp. WQ 349K1 TaxID=2800329 RepID=UPI001902DCB3|nr:DUF4282 domain-containing protein [Devosia sp. WQ 349K1]MBK1794570.1 DUF4282 domain-containing protein [Devosia sp. WQ 349K1]